MDIKLLIVKCLSGEILRVERALTIEGYFDKKGERTIGEIEIQGQCTALWRGYVATWKLENDSLFLVKIQTGYCSGYPNEVDISKEFKTNKIFANWVSSEIVNPYGRRIKYIHQGYGSIYEFERGFEFVKGKLERINNYDNSRSRESRFSKEPEILRKFLYDNINWQLIDTQKLKGKKTSIARFKVNENGRPTDIEIIRGFNLGIDNEAIRIIKLIPEWDIYFRRGKAIETQWILPISFDKELYEKNLKKENGG